jgi:hypothetical protein
MKDWLDSLTDDQFALLILLGIFGVVVFGGFMYKRGKRDEREKHEERRAERERELEQSGYDPAPYYRPKRKDDGNSKDNPTGKTKKTKYEN